MLILLTCAAAAGPGAQCDGEDWFSISTIPQLDYTTIHVYERHMELLPRPSGVFLLLYLLCYCVILFCCRISTPDLRLHCQAALLHVSGVVCCIEAASNTQLQKITCH
jgi:hypothetical protein